MKRLLLLSALAFSLFSCSADSEDLAAMSGPSAQRSGIKATLVSQITANPKDMYLSCFKNLAAHTEIDLSNGFGNGLINFVSEPPAGITGSYKVLVQVEEISDCENLASGTGNVRVFSDGLTYSGVVNNPPVVAGIAPAQTFACYRWNMVFQSINRSGGISCISSTAWYDAPLF